VLKGKIAVVTGGGRGLGRAIAVQLASQGVRVVVVSRTKGELEQTVSIIADRGGQAIAVKADISDPGDVQNLVTSFEMKLGPADILVNNAGIVGPLGDLKDIKIEDYNRCMEINAGGALLMSRALIPSMIKNNGGKIINVVSGLGEMVMPKFGAHSISKATLTHLTRILAKELERYNIQVNGLDPGTVDTKMQEDIRSTDVNIIGPDAYRFFWGLKNAGYLRNPMQAAQLAVFLASGESDDITGEVGSESHFGRWGYRQAA